MKNPTMKTMIAVAAFVAVAGVASAQNQTMEAKIPFAFRASGKVLAPGTYRVSVQSSGLPIVVIQNRESGVLTQARSNGDAKAAWSSTGKAVLQFECGSSRCSLTDVWMGGANPVYKVPAPSLGKDEPRRLAEIAMTPVKGD